jgi:hypothetical protein
MLPISNLQMENMTYLSKSGNEKVTFIIPGNTSPLLSAAGTSYRTMNQHDCYLDTLPF